MVIKGVKGVEKSTSGLDSSINATVDAESSAKMFTMFGKKMYSFPIDSMIRETASNALDANNKFNRDRGLVENRPISINFFISPIDNEHYLSIRDFGDGMSKEFLEKKFMSYLFSTKSENNLDLGGYGLGSKSPFAYTDSFEIESWNFQGYTKSILYEDISNPKLTFLEDRPLEYNELTGTCITIPIKKEDGFAVATAIKNQLRYFDTVHATIDRRIGFFYMFSPIYEHPLFFLKDISKEMHIVLGRVVYPISWEKLKSRFKEPINLPLGVRFDIGELPVTISREEIQYDEEVINLIADRIDNLLEYLKVKAEKEFKNIKSLSELYRKKSINKKVISFKQAGSLDAKCVDIVLDENIINLEPALENLKNEFTTNNVFSIIRNYKFNKFYNGELMENNYSRNKFSYNKKQRLPESLRYEGLDPEYVFNNVYYLIPKGYSVTKYDLIRNRETACYVNRIELDLDYYKTRKFLFLDTYSAFKNKNVFKPPQNNLWKTITNNAGKRFVLSSELYRQNTFTPDKKFLSTKINSLKQFKKAVKMRCKRDNISKDAASINSDKSIALLVYKLWQYEKHAFEKSFKTFTPADSAFIAECVEEKRRENAEKRKETKECIANHINGNKQEYTLSFLKNTSYSKIYVGVKGEDVSKYLQVYKAFVKKTPENDTIFLEVSKTNYTKLLKSGDKFVNFKECFNSDEFRKLAGNYLMIKKIDKVLQSISLHYPSIFNIGLKISSHFTICKKILKSRSEMFSYIDVPKDYGSFYENTYSIFCEIAVDSEENKAYDALLKEFSEYIESVRILEGVSSEVKPEILKTLTKTYLNNLKIDKEWKI